MAWVIGNASESAHFILQGAGKGAINAVSVGGLFSFGANATDAWFKPNPAAIAAHRQQWQEGAMMSRLSQKMLRMERLR